MIKPKTGGGVRKPSNNTNYPKNNNGKRKSNF